MKTTKKQRFPDITEVLLAILEAKVETIIGKDAIKEIKTPFLQKELSKKLLLVIKRAETRFISEHQNKEIARAIIQMPIADLPSIKDAIWRFYENPTNISTLYELQSEISKILGQSYPQEKVSIAASDYFNFIWEEMASLPDLREQLDTISTHRIGQNTAEMADTLSSIDKRLSSFGNFASSFNPSIEFNKYLLLEKIPLNPAFAHAQSTEFHWANRLQELNKLLNVWDGNKIRIASLIGWGGVGKSSLARKWFDDVYKQTNKPDGFFWWSFYYQPSLDEFLDSALNYLLQGSFQASSVPSPWAKAYLFIDLLKVGRFVFVLDGLEIMQRSQEQGNDFGSLEDKVFRNLIKLCAERDSHSSFILITSRFPVTDLEKLDGITILSLKINTFSKEDGANYLNRRGLRANELTLQALSDEYGGHALSLSLLASYIEEYLDGDTKGAQEIPFLGTLERTKVSALLHAYDAKLGEVQRTFMKLLSIFRRPLTNQIIKDILYEKRIFKDIPLFSSLTELSFFEIKNLVSNLERQCLIYCEKNQVDEWVYTVHLIVREFYIRQLAEDKSLMRTVYMRLSDYASDFEVVENPRSLDDLASMFDVVSYSCRAGKYDDAAQFYQENISHGNWGLGFKFGAYEFQISLLRDFFPNRDMLSSPLVSDSKYATLIYLEIAYCLDKLGQLADAANFCERAVKCSLAVSDYKGLAISYQALTGVLDPTGKLVEARNTANIALSYAQLANEKLRECNSLAKLGWISFLEGDIEQATKYYSMANTLKWSDNLEELGLFSILGVQYANFLLKTGRVEESLSNTKRNLEICQKKGWNESIAYCKSLLGDIALTNMQYDQAILEYLEALDIARKFGIQGQIARVLIGLAILASVQKEYDKALSNLKLALEICVQSNFLITEIDVLVSIAELSLLRQNFIEAKQYGQKALNYAEATNYAWGKGSALYVLGKTCHLLGNYRGAFTHLRKSIQIRIKIFDPRVEQTRKDLGMIMDLLQESSVTKR